MSQQTGHRWGQMGPNGPTPFSFSFVGPTLTSPYTALIILCVINVNYIYRLITPLTRKDSLRGKGGGAIWPQNGPIAQQTKKQGPVT